MQIFEGRLFQSEETAEQKPGGDKGVGIIEGQRGGQCTESMTRGRILRPWGNWAKDRRTSHQGEL